MNNAIQTVGILVCQLFFGCLAGFAFSKLRWRGRDACFLVVIACLIVPPQVRFVPLYMLFSKLGLLNTYASLIVPYAVSALGTFLIRDAFLQVQDDIVDAARVDGAGIFTLIFRVLAPIARPDARGLLAVQRGLPLERLLLAARHDDQRGGAHAAHRRGHAARGGHGRPLARHHGGQHVRGGPGARRSSSVAQRHIIRAFTFTSLK